MFADADRAVRRRSRRASWPRRCAASARSYTDAPPPATFRLIASPLVTWIWLGALIVFARRGDRALAGRRPARAGPRPRPGLARVARELERA